MLRKVPLIVILGSTGTGKTKLSVELVQKFGGEIISADSMQVYANLDVATAKATKEEQSKAKHHLLDVAEPTEPFTVYHYRNAALPIINDLLDKSKIPIVVGGTNYYIESVLWDILMTPQEQPEASTSSSSDQNIPNKYDKNLQQIRNLRQIDMKNIPTETLYEYLKNYDAASAERIHPNNKRKIIRALEILIETGAPMTEFLKKQRSQAGGNRLGGPFRFPHTIIFWLRCNQDTLNARLDKRVDLMLKAGLIPEIRNFYQEYLKISARASPELTKGILQTIGFKEFLPYLEKYDACQDILIENYLKANSYRIPELIGNDLPEGLEQLRSCLNELKLVTKRYSKKQIKWINNRFLSSKDRQVPAIYSLDTTNGNHWKKNVYFPAVNVIESYINEQAIELKPIERIQHPGVGLNEEVSNFCEICKRRFVGEFQFNLHLQSNKHKKRKDGLRKRAKLEAKGDTMKQPTPSTSSSDTE